MAFSTAVTKPLFGGIVTGTTVTAASTGIIIIIIIITIIIIIFIVIMNQFCNKNNQISQKFRIMWLSAISLISIKYLPLHYAYIIH